MRTLTIFLVFFFSLTVLAVAQEEGQQRVRNRNGGQGGGFPSGGQPPWMQGGRGGGFPNGGQLPWMQGQGGFSGGGDRGGFPGGGQQNQNDPNRNERMLGMLKAMDTNQNGLLEPNEIPEYRRGFVTMVVTQMGGNPNGTINLNDLTNRSNNSSRRQTGSSASGQTATPQGDPLVLPFGEKEETATSVLTFGQKESTSAVAAAVKPAIRAVSNQSLRSAQEIMAKYDKNKNGTLDKDKGEWVGLPINAETADKNRDGRISMTELIAVLGGQTSGSTGNAVVAMKQSAAYDHLPPGVPDWFFNMDKDQDGQLTMMEYVNERDGQWTKEIAKEFRFLDKNNDGVATVTEVFVVLKEVDEQRALEAEKKKRENDRRKGIAASPDSPPSSQPVPPEQASQQPVPPQVMPQQQQPAVPVQPTVNTVPSPPSNSVTGAIPNAAPYSSGSTGGTNNSERREPVRRNSRGNR